MFFPALTHATEIPIVNDTVTYPKGILSSNDNSLWIASSTASGGYWVAALSATASSVGTDWVIDLGVPSGYYNSAIAGCSQPGEDTTCRVRLHLADVPADMGNFAIGDYAEFFIVGGQVVSAETETRTRFISLTPANGSTVATSTNVGALVYANPDDFPNYGILRITASQDSAFACMNSTVLYDAIYTCGEDNDVSLPFEIVFEDTLERLIAGTENLIASTTFPAGGDWTLKYEIQQVSEPWYFLGLYNTYNTIVSTTTNITIGQQNLMDIRREELDEASRQFASSTASGIGATLASTTLQFKNACKIISTTFDMGDCLTLAVWPGSAALAENYSILKQTPPWGYIFRILDIANMDNATTTLPVISYTFADSNPMSTLGAISFDPFDQIAEAGDLIRELKSDRDNEKDVWTIFMPFITIFMYLVLIFKIIHDLTGIHSEPVHNTKKIP